MSAEIKLWKLNMSDWVAATTLEEAKQVLYEMIEGAGTVTPQFEEDYIEDPYCISEEDMDKLTLGDADDPTAPTQTFRESLEEMKKDGTVFPCHFATNEY